MKGVCRIILFVFLLVALPLRGYAGVLMVLCESHHGGASVAGEYVHEHGDNHHQDSGQGAGGQPHAASFCSVCASCSASAGLAAPSIQRVVIPPPGTGRISFLDRQIFGFVLERLERPPLAL